MSTSRLNWLKYLTVVAGLAIGLHAGIANTGAMQPDDKAPAKTENERTKAKAEFEAKKADPCVKRIYLIPLRGEFGRDISQTPMRRALADAKKEQADIILFSIDTSFTIDGQTYNEWATIIGQRSWGQGPETARELATMFHEGIRDDATWKTRDGGKPRIAGWVRKAMGPSAMLTLSIPELYFVPDARVGGIGYLNLLFDGQGDEVVQEKQRSLRLGRFEGMVRDGGYPVIIARAMARSDQELSFSQEGGKPIFKYDLSGDEVLVDGGGGPNKERRDTFEQLVRFEGNDVLTLNANVAYKLGVNKQNAATEDDLVSNMGVERNYVMITDRARKIFRDWTEEVGNAERTFAKAWRDYNDIQVTGATAAERNSLRGRRLSILNNIKRELEKYKESISAEKIDGAPKQWVSEINVMIDRIRQEMRLDR